MTLDQIMENEKFFPDDEQRAVIETTGNTVVSAGAGAGKTAVLSWRFLRLVMQENVKPEQILTLTFTKKAANEMRSRIYKCLVKAKESLPEDTLDSFRKASISTLDSFCSKIVRSDVTRFGLPRDVANLSDEDLDSLSERLAVRFLGDPENSEEAKALSSLLMPAAVMGSFFSVISRNSSIARDYDSARITTSFRETVREEYFRRKEEALKLIEQLSEMNLSDSFRDDVNAIGKAIDTDSIGETDDFNLRRARDPETKELARDIRELVLKNSGFADLRAIAFGEGISILQRAVEKFTKLLNEEKKRVGALTFNDVADLSVRILRDNAALRDTYKKNYRFIMIDEFQDNNSLQRDLLFLLSERTDKAAVSGEIPSVADLEPSKLFFVGDEKQSIYKFRGADVSVFRRLENEMKKNGSSLTLSSNYRSQKKLINHFNAVFDRILTPSDSDFREFEARSNPIKPGRKGDGTDAEIILSVFRQDMIDRDLFDKDSFEAEIIGEWCRKVLDENDTDFLIAGEHPKPSDIAILFRTAGNQMNIEKALKRRGIPYQLTETRSLMIDAVANDFYSFINCIVYPKDIRSFVAVLKSPFCGMSEENIKYVLNEDIDSIPEIDKDRFNAFSAFFASMKEKAFRLTLSQFLEALWIEGGYKAFIESEYDREVFAEHYEYLYSYAVAMESEGNGLAAFARFLRDNTGQSEKLPETPVLFKEKTGVQLMTVHKSKGLDFKIVIFAGMGTRPKADASSYVFRWKDGLVATENKNILNVLEKEARDKEEAELKRILYVALTRAKDHLILSGGYKVNKDGSPSCGPILKKYMEAVGFDPSLNCCNLKEVSVSDWTDFIPDSTRTHREKNAADVRDAYPVFVESSLTSAVTASHEEGLSFSEGEKLPVFDSDPITVSQGLRDKFGTLCHSALELFFKDGNTDALSCDFCATEGENRILLARARAFAQGFSDSSFYKEHIEGHKTHPEMRFYTYDENNPDIAVEGVIDLLVEGNDYNLVVDYKTDALRNPEVHKHQLMTYVRVAKELTGKESRGVLYYLRDGSLGPVWDKDGKEITI